MTLYGFWIYNSAGSTLTQNTASGSGAGGPYLADGSGFYLSDSSSSKLSGNTAAGNGVYGFYLDNSTSGSTLSGNLADSNANYGYFDNSMGSGTRGTANLYQSDECIPDGVKGSNPTGLCASFRTLATLPMNCGAGPLVITEGYVYWLNACGYEIQRVSESGGPIQNLTKLPSHFPTSVLLVDGMVASGPWLFWTQETADLVTHTIGNASLMRAPVWGGPAQLVTAIGGVDISAPTASGNYIYFSEDGTLMRITPYGTGLRTVLSDPTSAIWQVVISHESLYWYDPSDGSIYASSLLGVGITRLSGPSPHSGGGGVTPGVRDVIVASGSVFWTDSRNGTNTLNSVSVNGGPTLVLSSGGPDTFFTTVADAGRSVAFLAAGSTSPDPGIFLVPKTGGVVIPLVDRTTVLDMAISGSSVFFSALNATESTIDVAQLPSG